MDIHAFCDFLKDVLGKWASTYDEALLSGVHTDLVKLNRSAAERQTLLEVSRRLEGFRDNFTTTYDR